MKARSIPLLTVVCILFLIPAASARSAEAILTTIPPTPVEDDTLDAEEGGGPELRAVAAVSRGAITGRVGSFLLVPRPGRTLNVVEGESVRFIAAVREAVWYAGSGSVEQALAVHLVNPDGTTTPAGRDLVALSGAAPKIDQGRAKVDVTFPSAGRHVLDVVARGAATPRNGRGQTRTDRSRWEVRVWNAADLGSIAGHVASAADGAPIAGLRVVALDPASRQPVGAAWTDCDGGYELKRLPPGDYLVAVRGGARFAGEFWDDASDASLATPVPVAAGNAAAGIDFAVTPR